MKVTLDQWMTFVAIVEHGGYMRASEYLNKGQSTLSYAISKIESELDVRLFEQKGRKSSLTTVGRALYQKAKVLIEDADQIEELSEMYRDGTHNRIKIAVDVLFPMEYVQTAIEQLLSIYPKANVEVHETILSATQDAAMEYQCDLFITVEKPHGIEPRDIFSFELGAIANNTHPLHQLTAPIGDNILCRYRQIVLRDQGSKKIKVGWLQSQNQIVVNQPQTVIEMVKRGLGFAWLPLNSIKEELNSGQLKLLNIENYRIVKVMTMLVNTKPQKALPIVFEFEELLRAAVIENEGYIAKHE